MSGWLTLNWSMTSGRVSEWPETGASGWEWLTTAFGWTLESGVGEDTVTSGSSEGSWTDFGGGETGGGGKRERCALWKISQPFWLEAPRACWKSRMYPVFPQMTSTEPTRWLGKISIWTKVCQPHLMGCVNRTRLGESSHVIRCSHGVRFVFRSLRWQHPRGRSSCAHGRRCEHSRSVGREHLSFPSDR